MPERELTPEREKRRKDFQAESAAGSSAAPSEDASEDVVSPEAEGEALETEGETTRKIDKTKKR